MDRLIRASSSAAATTTSASGGGGGGGGSGSSELPCDRVMDSIALERERGITIASKYTSVTFRGTTLNLVDTPGHADFGGEVRSEGGAAGDGDGGWGAAIGAAGDGDGGWGAAIGGCGVGAHTTPTSHPLFPPLPPTQVQRVMGMVDGALLLVDVERVMGMVDGALLLVDVAEGPLAQTKFVLGKALQRGLKPIVVLNKCDRPSVTTQMVHQVESAIFDLFASFDATGYYHVIRYPISSLIDLWMGQILIFDASSLLHLLPSSTHQRSSWTFLCSTPLPGTAGPAAPCPRVMSRFLIRLKNRLIPATAGTAAPCPRVMSRFFIRLKNRLIPATAGLGQLLIAAAPLPVLHAATRPPSMSLIPFPHPSSPPPLTHQRSSWTSRCSTRPPDTAGPAPLVRSPAPSHLTYASFPTPSHPPLPIHSSKEQLDFPVLYVSARHGWASSSCSPLPRPPSPPLPSPLTSPPHSPIRGAAGLPEEQLDFPVLYASARHGWASSSWPPPQLTAEGAAAASEAAAAKGESGVVPILEAILDRVPPPVVDPTAPFQMLVSLIDRDPFLGRLLIGRIASGSLVKLVKRRGVESEDMNEVVKLVKRRGVKSEDMSEAAAGDIVAVAGMTHAHVSQTLADLSVSKPLPVAAIDPPTIAMTFSVNDSPLAGRHGTQWQRLICSGLTCHPGEVSGDISGDISGDVSGPKIGARLKAEVATNVSLGLEAGPSADAFKVLARGEMQLGVLIESMRREGFELSISPPSVLYREEKGKKLEPIEELMVEVDEEYAGVVIDSISLYLCVCPCACLCSPVLILSFCACLCSPVLILSFCACLCSPVLILSFCACLCSPVDEESSGAVIDVDEEFAGAVIDAISLRKGELLDMITESSSSSDSSSSVADSVASATSSPSPSTSSPSSASSAILVSLAYTSSLHLPFQLLFTRARMCAGGLLGVRGVLNTATRGTAVLHRSFLRECSATPHTLSFPRIFHLPHHTSPPPHRTSTRLPEAQPCCTGYSCVSATTMPHHSRPPVISALPIPPTPLHRSSHLKRR
ncbi:unnamed protein product [Closterium sp. NIES-65]|nr:unnamed protein product [Closterium sp. NIES-65]